MAIIDDERALALEQFLDDMLEASATLSRLAEEPPDRLKGLILAYAEQIAERARALQALRSSDDR